MIHPTAAVLAALCLSLAACGGGSADSAKAADPHPAPVQAATTPAGAVPPASAPGPAASVESLDICALLAGVDLDAALGEAAGPPRASGAHCEIKPADASSPASMLVHYADRGGAALYARQNALFGVDSPLPDLGDEAIATGTRIHALAGDAFLRVQIVRNPAGSARQIRPDQVATISRQIARTAGW